MAKHVEPAIPPLIDGKPADPAKMTRIEPLSAPPAPKGKTKRSIDPMLQATHKLDKLIGTMTPDMRHWALAWLQLKYGPNLRQPMMLSNGDNRRSDGKDPGVLGQEQ